ncbi:lysine--tRNA ligase [bacterium]|nr:lysine--tRNA ligase [bacterium]
MKEMDDLILQRIEKLNKLKEQGIDPYPNKFLRTHLVKEIQDKYAKLTKEERTDDVVSIAGRMMLMRDMGKTTFSHIKDGTGMIQIYMRQDNIGKESYDRFKKLDIGDIIGVKGEVFSTKTGELSIYVQEYELLAKSLRSLPEKWHGLKDIELRYRQRYLDLIVNDDVKNIFLTRSSIVKNIRNFLDNLGFLEVETPMMQSIVGGATAKPFVTHHEALDMDLYLRIAPELYLKRLIVGGFEKVYEINRNFRNEGISTRHSPEFTMLEVYKAYADYNEMMDFCQSLISSIVKEILGKEKFEYQGKKVNLKLPWKRRSLYDLLKEHTGIDFSNINTDDELKKVSRKLNVDYTPQTPTRKIFDHIFEAFVQPTLVDPTFVLDYPKKYSPLAKAKKASPMFVERFELFIGAEELANAYSELNDPIEQRERMEEEAKLKASGDEEAGLVDEDYLKALEHSMPPCAGLGIGIDRLVMVFTNSSSIRDVILFPQMRKE